MAVYDLEEQEQIENIKSWWQQHGNRITGVIAVVSVAVVAWQGWNWYQAREAAQASTVFAALQQAMVANDAPRVRAVAGELTEKFGGSVYAPLGAMMAAKVSMDAGDTKTARAQLAWVVSNGKEELRDLARLRLVAVLLDDKAYDEAMKELAVTPAPAFAAQYAELKGDVLTAQNRAKEAREAYQAALDKLAADQEGPAREILKQKMDALGGAL